MEAEGVGERMINWEQLNWLIECVPNNLDRDKKKIKISNKDREYFESRHKGICYVCGKTNPYGSTNIYLSNQMNYKLSHLHHVVPNGDTSDVNIKTLCTHCHQTVHQLLFVSGKWKFVRPV
jgi:hypothetical protein